MALTTVSSDRLSTNVKTSNLGSELSKKVGQNKNLIINGAMTIQQRMDSSTSGGQNLTGIKTVDRFSLDFSGTDNPPTQIPVDVAAGTTPYTSGFRRCFKIINGNQTSGAGADDSIVITYKTEAQDMANSGWNYTSASSYVTLSFWVKASVAQNYFFRLQTRDGTNYNYPMETGALSADTWTKITKTIPGNSNLVINNDNGEGPKIEWCMFRGTNQTASSVTLNQWAAAGDTITTPDQTSTWYTTDDATFEITGVQLEVGSVATDFEFRSFGHEISLCERYFQRIPRNPSDGYGGICNGRCNSSTTAEQILTFPEMRATPTLNSSGNLRILHGGSAKGVNSITLLHGARTTIFFSVAVPSGLSSGDAAQLTLNNAATAHITLTAEL